MSIDSEFAVWDFCRAVDRVCEISDDEFLAEIKVLAESAQKLSARTREVVAEHKRRTGHAND